MQVGQGSGLQQGWRRRRASARRRPSCARSALAVGRAQSACGSLAVVGQGRVERGRRRAAGPVAAGDEGLGRDGVGEGGLVQRAARARRLAAKAAREGGVALRQRRALRRSPRVRCRAAISCAWRKLRPSSRTSVSASSVMVMQAASALRAHPVGVDRTGRQDRRQQVEHPPAAVEGGIARLLHLALAVVHVGEGRVVHRVDDHVAAPDRDAGQVAHVFDRHRVALLRHDRGDLHQAVRHIELADLEGGPELPCPGSTRPRCRNTSLIAE